MRKVVSFCVAMFFVGVAFTQTGKMKDCIMMKNDSMMVMKGGKAMMLMEDTTVSNGTIVMKNGMVKMKDGSSHMMKDGECIMNGKVKMMKMDKMDSKM